MKAIKFSHHYPKMPTDVTKSTLLEVIEVQLADLSQIFLDYDTTTDKGFQYQLPKTGMYLLLLLFDDNACELWTTLRHSTPEKRKYYRDSIGEVFNIVITEAAP